MKRRLLKWRYMLMYNRRRKEDMIIYNLICYYAIPNWYCEEPRVSFLEGVQSWLHFYPKEAGIFQTPRMLGACVLCYTHWEESSQTNVVFQYKLLASNLSAVCSVILQSEYVLHFYYTLYDGKYDCKITTH